MLNDSFPELENKLISTEIDDYMRNLIITLAKLDILREFSNHFLNFVTDEVLIHKAISTNSLFSDIKEIVLNSYMADYTLVAVVSLKYYINFQDLSANATSTVVLKLFRQIKD